MRIEKPTVFIATPDEQRRLRMAAPVVPASIVAISDTISAVTFDIESGDHQRGRAARLGGEIGGRGFPRPAISTRLPLRAGGRRHVLLVDQPAEKLAATHACLTLDDAPVSAIDPRWLQSPLADVSALVGGLTEDGRRRLLRMLATTGASLYGGGRAPGFGAAILRLVRALGVAEVRAASQVALGSDAMLLSCRLPADRSAIDVEALVALSEDRVTRVTGFSAVVEKRDDAPLLHLVLPAAAPGVTLLATGAWPMTLDVSAAGRSRTLAAWFARRPPEIRDWVGRTLGTMALSDPTCAALQRELRYFDAPPPTLVVHNVSAAPAGLLLLAGLRDPNGLIGAVQIEVGGVLTDLAVPARPRQGDDHVAIGGFIAIPGFDGPEATCRFRLVHRSGRREAAGDQRIAAFDGAVPAGFARLGGAAASAAIAAARLSSRRHRAAIVETIGAPPRDPQLGLVAPASANPDLLRARAALLFAEPGAADVETVYLAGAAEADAVVRLLTGAGALFGLGCRVLIFAADVDPAERLRVALGSLRSRSALVVGADVLPQAAGWLGTWRAALGQVRGPALRGGTLLSSDGAVIDAGGSVRLDVDRDEALIERRACGLPAGLLPREATVPTDLVSADCVGLTRRAIAALDRIELHHPEPDVLLAALAWRLRRNRAANVTMVQARFVRFGDERRRHSLDAAADAGAIASLCRGFRRKGRG